MMAKCHPSKRGPFGSFQEGEGLHIKMEKTHIRQKTSPLLNNSFFHFEWAPFGFISP